jgi:hypothetical protein
MGVQTVASMSLRNDLLNGMKICDGEKLKETRRIVTVSCCLDDNITFIS